MRQFDRPRVYIDFVPGSYRFSSDVNSDPDEDKPENLGYARKANRYECLGFFVFFFS
jgi:hypothetical protein